MEYFCFFCPSTTSTMQSCFKSSIVHNTVCVLWFAPWSKHLNHPPTHSGWCTSCSLAFSVRPWMTTIHWSRSSAYFTTNASNHPRTYTLLWCSEVCFMRSMMFLCSPPHYQDGVLILDAPVNAPDYKSLTFNQDHQLGIRPTTAMVSNSSVESGGGSSSTLKTLGKNIYSYRITSFVT